MKKKTKRLSAIPAQIHFDLDHPLIQLTDFIDWDELLGIVEQTRRTKLKSAAGKPPNLRALTGAILMKSRWAHSYRDEEDLIRHYVPARYVCGLMDSQWTPAKSTIWDFEELLGEEGKKEINEYIVKQAVKNGFADPDSITADTTAQEASIPHPNEIGLMASFFRGASKACRHVGKFLGDFSEKLNRTTKKAAKKIRTYRLFAKTREEKTEIIEQMTKFAETIQKNLSNSLKLAGEKKEKLVNYEKVAMRTLQLLLVTIQKLIPQIRYWLKTGFVASDKIISMHIPEVYSIVRGKVGKKVEFGLNWGFARLRGGYLLARCATDKKELHDSKYAVTAVDDHIRVFKKKPRDFGYDRGADFPSTFTKLKQRGIKNIAIARKGKARWAVSNKIKKELIRERAQVEGCIGTVKRSRYCFNKPAARSTKKMASAGHGAVLGFNINKLLRDRARPKPGDTAA